MSKLPTIKKSIIFKSVYKYGLAIKCNGFTLRFLQISNQNVNINPSPFQFGFILSKKVGTSVKRNYIKRRLKCAIYECLKDFNLKGYYVFIANSTLSYVTYKNLVLNIQNALNILDNIVNKNGFNK